jgi:hypothetical protein
MPDVAEYLQEIPLDWLSDAANLLSKTLRFGVASSNDSMDNGEKSGDSSDGPSRIPPGKSLPIRVHRRCFAVSFHSIRFLAVDSG